MQYRRSDERTKIKPDFTGRAIRSRFRGVSVCSSRVVAGNRVMMCILQKRETRVALQFFLYSFFYSALFLFLFYLLLIILYPDQALDIHEFVLWEKFEALRKMKPAI